MLQKSTQNISNKTRLVFRLLAIAWHVRPLVIAGFFGGAIIEIGASILSIYATAKLGSLLAIYLTRHTSGSIWFWLWADICAAIAIGIGFWVMAHTKRLLYFRTVSWYTHAFFLQVCNIDLPDFYDNTLRNQMNKAQNGYSWQLPNLTETCLDLVYAILRFVAIAAVVAQISWWLIPLAGLFLLPTLFAETKLAKVQWFVWDAQGDSRHVFWGLDWLIRQAKGQMELRSLQARSYIVQKIDAMNHTFYRKQESEYKQAARVVLPAKILEVGGVAIGSIVVLKQFLSGHISLDRYFFLSGALLRIGGALNAVFSTASRMQEPLLFAENYFAFIDHPAKMVDKPGALQLPGKGAPEIVFDNVSFNYPGQDTLVFNNLNLTLRTGEHVALVGENGAGKSTLIKLLLRFYVPTGGRILVDGTDLQNIAIESWYAQLATLFQDFNQYPLPIDENIAIARSSKSKDVARLQEAARFGGVDTLVKNYKHGWDTVLDSSFEKGTEPSGGQWQRVALARAFYRDADVIILDEPTSAIDAKAEYDIFNNIFEHYQNKTALIVSHRFSTVRRANRIIVLDKGTILEQGSHSELMKRKGLYHELFTKQAEGYRD